MLTRLEVTNSSGETLVLPLTNEGTGYIVQEIDGLGPVKASVVSSTFANFDGAQHQSSRREMRNITIKLGLEPDYYDQTIRSLRQEIYAWFIPKSYVRLRFHLGTGIDYDIYGYVESLDAPLFTKDPALDISILCMKPDFIDSDATIINGTSTATLSETSFVYRGTSPTGFLFTLMPNRNISSFDIHLRMPDGTYQSMSFTSALLSGDILTVNTVLGEKAVTRLRASVETSMLQSLTSASRWPQLVSGTSHLRVYVPGSVPIPYKITYKNAYGGL